MNTVKDDEMREEYNFSKANARKNPYACKLKKQITLNINVNTIEFFKNKAAKSGIPYQTRINLYLTDCAENNREMTINWK